MKKLVIIGAGGHGAVAADIARLLDYEQIVFLDDAAEEGRLGIQLAGKFTAYPQYIDGWEFFVAIGNNYTREKLQRTLTAQGAEIATLIHPAVVMGAQVMIGRGSIAMAGVVVNAATRIGEGVILNTCSSVDHDCTVGAFSHISVGAHLAGTVRVGERTYVGAGATIINDVCVGSDCILGAGAVAVRDITTPGTYIGIPAQERR